MSQESLKGKEQHYDAWLAQQRRVQCDGAHPTCRSCAKADAFCIYERPLRPQYPGGKSLYITALEERIAFLESRIPGLAEDHFEVGAISIQQRGALHLIYAISARCLQLTKKQCNVDPEVYLAAAIEHMDFILEQHDLVTVQFLLLLALHG
ncbi:hypothetical protein GGTG_08983 [Gaeumannomyces tritici R3-111a-1]|uniref:Zn(2)-C6 fungal-type domain-containing protein n=1 Tax=Gaeumannomyces tritici (strain R3-111a-1) TaxID=644352 RepID=J3P642_GAET3|nr:hypothetical protein GGTG_08983 [Gaeumannomyces tritici R3-111a-1]EJT72115.1 hypothetical protein GGTG_08983 [Gaeumannomyces tritici R3-111a-1]